MTLQLEYICTEAEEKEAQALHLRQHYGGGSKWRTRRVLFGIFAFTLGLTWLRFAGVDRRELAAACAIMAPAQ